MHAIHICITVNVLTILPSTATELFSLLEQISISMKLRGRSGNKANKILFD